MVICEFIKSELYPPFNYDMCCFLQMACGVHLCVGLKKKKSNSLVLSMCSMNLCHFAQMLTHVLLKLKKKSCTQWITLSQDCYPVDTHLLSPFLLC